MEDGPFSFYATGGKGTKDYSHGSTSRVFDGSQYYQYANGIIRCGMIVCQFQLAD